MSEPQHMEALAFANEIRLAHAAIRRRIKAGELTFQQAIELPHGDRMPISKLFGAYRGSGPRAVQVVCRAAGIRDYRAWRDITDRQRRVVLELGEWFDDGNRALPWHYDSGTGL